MIERRDLFIGGKFVAPSGRGTLAVVSPSTEEEIGSVPRAEPADVDRAVAAAREAFDRGPWPRMRPAERADALRRVSKHLGGRAEELAQLITAEMGAPISFCRVAQTGTTLLDYYAEIGSSAPVEEPRRGMMAPLLVRREPVGVAALIIPWNAPMGLCLGKLAPALMAGCTTVVKPAPETPLDAYFLAEAVMAADVPPGVVNIVAVDRDVGEHLVRHPGVDKVSFTGSTAAGKRIMSLCGEQVKRVTLELGGKSACILLEDADLAAALPFVVMGATLNNGEACIALTRVLAPRGRYDEIVDGLAHAMSALTVGDPFDPATRIGPLVSARQRSRVEGYIADGRRAGAKIVVGGGRPRGLERGWYVEPTLFRDVDNGMKVAREEIFGPVVCVIPYGSGEEAVAIANDSPYGLCGAVWTRDLARGVEVARQVRTGTFSVNGFTWDLAAPFGGFKQSGLGREWGPEGLADYQELKTVALPADARPEAFLA